MKLPVAALLAVAVSAEAAAPDVAGLWAAERHFGPEVLGELTVFRESGQLRAEIAGRAAPVLVEGSEWRFELPGGEGAFRGRLVKEALVGHWIQARMQSNGSA